MIKNDFYKIIDGNIGYINGSPKVLFIKTGQGGSFYGYKNKYLDLALKINAERGMSVFVSATTSDTKESFDKDINIIEKELGTSQFEIYYLGVSKGGLIGLWYGANEPRIVKMLCINSPLMINYHSRTLPSIKKIGLTKLTMVYGSLDPSYRYIPFIEKYSKVVIINGEDHNFTQTEKGINQVVDDNLIQLIDGN